MKLTLTPHQARVIGVLLEKEITTPDQYPLSLNAVMLGCNQKSNRDPVLQLTETEVQQILDELDEKRLLFVERGSRVDKYKHRFCNTEFSDLQFSQQALALVCVMLLRGAQTPGELRSRCGRLADFANVSEVESTLEELSDYKGDALVVKLAREPGRRESRYMHTFCGEVSNTASSAEQTPTASVYSDSATDGFTLAEAKQRIEALEAKMAELMQRLND